LIEANIQESFMPLSVYPIEHKYCTLSLADKQKITDWEAATKDGIEKSEH